MSAYHKRSLKAKILELDERVKQLEKEVNPYDKFYLMSIEQLRKEYEIVLRHELFLRQIMLERELKLLKQTTCQCSLCSSYT